MIEMNHEFLLMTAGTAHRTMARRATARPRFFSTLVSLLLLLPALAGTRSNGEDRGWKAGVAKTEITPDQPMWLAGYASRTKPAEGKEMPLWIKVLAIEDAEGRRALILTSDTLGIPQGIYKNVCAALKTRFKLEPQQILLTASHTHCGPVLRNSLYDAYPLDESQIK